MFNWIPRKRQRPFSAPSHAPQRKRDSGRSGIIRYIPGSSVALSEIHFSLVLSLLLISGILLGLSYWRPGFAEFRTAALTLPLVWLASLAVRAAAQQLSIGDHSHDSATSIGPSGNIHTDYEYLPPRVMVAYGISGQLASIALMSIGLVVSATFRVGVTAGSSASEHQQLISQLLEFRGGWSSEALATQIFWVNLFLFLLNLLPTVPFDTRALAFSFFSWRLRSAQEPQIFRNLAAVDSHLAALMIGVGIASIGFRLLPGEDVAGWYASIAVAACLFVASQREHSRADELDEQFMPLTTRIRARKSAAKLRSQGNVESPPIEATSEPIDFLPQGENGPLAKLTSEQASNEQQASDQQLAADGRHAEGPAAQESTCDIDEILRKLHRAGLESLSEDERQALLTASRQINEKRGLH